MEAKNFYSADAKVCRVCNMDVDDDGIKWDYQKIRYFFCSKQCLNRFREYPHLYIGDPRLGKAEKQKGTRVIKCHKLHLKECLDDRDRKKVIQQLNTLMGIKNIDIKGKQIIISYDLMEVSLGDIEVCIESAVGSVDSSGFKGLKQKLVHFSEECELDSLSQITKGHRHG